MVVEETPTQVGTCAWYIKPIIPNDGGTNINSHTKYSKHIYLQVTLVGLKDARGYTNSTPNRSPFNINSHTEYKSLHIWAAPVDYAYVVKCTVYQKKNRTPD